LTYGLKVHFKFGKER